MKKILKQKQRNDIFPIEVKLFKWQICHQKPQIPAGNGTFSNAERRDMPAPNSVSGFNYPSEIKEKSRHSQIQENEENAPPIQPTLKECLNFFF